MTSGKLENTLVSMFKAVKGFPTAHLVKLSTVFNRIREEKNMATIENLRQEPDKEKAAEIKKTLPVICFSGEFEGARHSDNFKKHSGLICLDFDKMTFDEMEMRKEYLTKKPFVVSVFTSPSGNGLKCVVRILNTDKHTEHYEALLKEFPDADKSTKDIARACFDCADKFIYTNYNAVPYTKIIETTKSIVQVQRSENLNGNNDFQRIEKWLEKRRNVYESGNRNNFIFALACACCRFGIIEEETASLIHDNYLSKDTEFTVNEMMSGIKSAYKRSKFGTAEFSNDRLVEKETKHEVEIDLSTDIVDVIYAEDCYTDAEKIYFNGYESAESTGIEQIDRIFKWKRGELTVLTGIGNFGKSAWLEFLMINKAIKDGTKWAIFSPENNPAHEFYHNLTEVVIGNNCAAKNPDGTENQDRPPLEIYKKAYDFVGKHFFYIYPKEVAPTPEYIHSRFVELVLKEKVDGVVIDPFNQLSNDYGARGRDDRYLETFLSDCCRFAVKNNVYYVIIAHPHKLQKDKDTKAYPCPDVFDLAGGAMWNNKADNILVYHRPNHHTDPMDRLSEMHSKKIRRQKIVGEKGVEQFDYSRPRRRFVFDTYPLKYYDLGVTKKPSFGGKVKDYSEPIIEEDPDKDVPF